jgi:hypothetical protein
MAAEQRRYTPIYRDIMEEPEIWDDDVLCVAWFRLRLTADRVWPDAASLPRSVSDATAVRLVELGKILLVGRDQYRCRGVDMDRSAKSAQARAAAETRWAGHAPALRPQSSTDAPALRPHELSNAQVMPTDTETDTENHLNPSEVSVNAREPRRRRTPVRGFTGPMGR